MKLTQNNTSFLTVTGIIVLAASFRLLPHWPNFTPIAAMALFGGAHVSRRWLAFMLPIIAMLMADLVLGFHAQMPAVYGAFILTVVLGRLLRQNSGASYVVAASLSASTLFFLITNFAVWVGSPYYSQSFAGLLSSYTAGLPFFLNSIAGDLFYSGVLFGTYYMVSNYVPILKRIE